MLNHSRATYFYNKGFSLLELMVVISIVTLLATLTMANYKRFIIKAAHAEANLNLRTGHTLMITLVSEYDPFNNAIHATPITLQLQKAIKDTRRYMYYPDMQGRNEDMWVMVAMEQGSCTDRGISNYCSRGDSWAVAGNGALLPYYDSYRCAEFTTPSLFPGMSYHLATNLLADQYYHFIGDMHYIGE